MLSAEDTYKPIVIYNIDQVFFVTLQFAVNMFGFIYLATLELNHCTGFENPWSLNEREFYILRNELLKGYEKTGMDKIYPEPFLIEAIKQIPQLTSPALARFYKKAKAVKANDQIPLDLDEMLMLYCLLHLSCLSFISGMDDLHKHHINASEYGDIKRIIITSMKEFMKNISEWIREYDAFKTIKEDLHGLGYLV